MTTAMFLANPTYTLGNFRIWTQKMHDAILSTGINDASGSGSITYGKDSTAFESIAAPGTGVANVSGFQTYKFNDALQATHPVYIRIKYGGGSAATYPSLYVTVGTTHNTDSGSVSGPPVTLTDDQYAGNGVMTDEPAYWMVAGGDNWLVLTGPAWEPGTAATADETFLFSVERTKDTNGDDTDEGILVAGVNSSATYRWYTMPFVGLTPPFDSKWSTVVSNLSSPMTFGGRQMVCPLFPITGVKPYPGKNILVTQDENFRDLDVIPISIYPDVTNNYFKHPLGGTTAGFNQPGAGAQAVILHRWD